ncbi:MAG: carboxypeptidase regulatory-like domain-containing protein, partial [Acidobacteria bacterium]|nr:carboxypeptidase regulatory-like domain-containing protein [Acidobacteriota bacterium]
SSFKHKGRLAPFRFVAALGVSLFAAAGALMAQPTVGPPLTVTGTLVDERGAPAAGVEVALRPYPSAYELDLDLLGYDALPAAVDRTRSGPDGGFLLRAPVPGPYRFEIRTGPPTASHDAVVPPVYANLAPLEAPRALQANELPDRHLVDARVLDADGRPIGGALVIARPTRTRSPRHEGRNANQQPERLYPRFQGAAARTDEEGNARFLMPTTNATVTVSASGFAVETATTEAGRAAFVLARDPGIRFRVRAPDGAPAPGVLLRTGGKAKAPLALTNEQGEAIVGSVAGTGAAYEVQRWDNAFARVSQPDATPAERIVDLRLEAPLRIPGRIVDRVSGAPVAGAALWVVGSPGENAQSGPTGEFLLNSRPREESIHLRVSASGYVSTGVSAGIPEYGVTDETTVTLRPAAPLYGFVTDAADQPIAGASISAQPRATESITSMIAIRPQRATSADDGSFRMAGIVYDNPYRLTIRAKGFASFAIDLPPYEPGATAGPVRIRLPEGRPARGRVVDTDGNPVAGAEVTLRWPEQKRPRFASRRDTDATEPVETDAQGAFVIATVKTGEYGLRVSHAEYVSPGDLPIEVPEGRGDVDLGDFTLVPGAEILGVVVDPDQEPVEGALVRFREYDPERNYERTATTDAEGSFTLAGLPHEQVDLTVEAEGYPLFPLRGARTATGETILIQLVPGASLSGRVLTVAGTAAVGARVHLEPDMQTRLQGRIFSSRDMTRRTDGDGRFVFGHLFPGTWSVEASTGTEAARTDPLELVSGSERTIELHLHAQDHLTVIVTSSSGRPVTEARIRLEPKDAAQSREYDITDGSGRARLEVRAGPATLTIEHPEHLDETREIVVAPGSTELAVQLQTGGEINGVVRSPSGTPVSATVEAHPEETAERDVSLRRYMNPPTTTATDNNGFFRLTGLEAGRYFLVGRAAGYAESGPVEPIDVDGRGVAGVELVLESGASLRGAVTGLRLADLAEVTVTATRQAQWQSATPDTEGSFTIQNLAPGTWQVVARRGDSFTSRSVERSVTITVAGAEEFIELPFDRGLRLTGQVLISGAPLVGGQVLADRQGHEDPRFAELDQQGRFEMSGLAAGSYRLRVSTRFDGAEYRMIELQTDLEGLRIDLQPEAILSGIVLDATTGLPLRDASLEAGDAASIAALASGDDGRRVYFSGVIAGRAFSTNGRFEIRLGPRAEQLWVTHDGYQGALVPLNIGPGQRQEGLVIQLQPAASEPEDR